MAMCSRRLFLVIATMVLTAMFSGVIYGWTAMQVMLVRMGIYHQFSAGVQQEKFVLIETVGGVCTASSGIFIGAVLDWMGPRFTVFASGVLMVAGSIVFGYEISFIIGYALWAVGGMGVLISAFRVGFVYPKKMNMIIGAVSCLFDTSSVVFLFFAMLNELPGLTLRNLCIGFGIAAIICYGAVVVGWSLNKKLNDGGSVEDEDGEDGGDADEETGLTSGGGASETTSLLASTLTNPTYQLVADMPLSKQLRSPEFIFVYSFTVINMFLANIFLGTAANFMETLGDAHYDDLFSKILAGIIPLGVVFVPVISWLLDVKGFAFTGYVTVALSIGYNALSIVPILEVQLVTALLFTAFRACLYSFVAAYNAKIFGVASVGRITGILYTTAAVFVFCQVPLTDLTVVYFHSSYIPLNSMLTVLAVISLFLVIWIQCKSKEVGPPGQMLKAPLMDPTQVKTVTKTPNAAQTVAWSTTDEGAAFLQPERVGIN